VIAATLARRLGRPVKWVDTRRESFVSTAHGGDQEHEATLGARAVCVRSSATEEDLREASFAGQYETYLNVLSTEAVIRHVLDVWASFYSPHALSYKLERGISPLRGAMAVAVQALVASHAAGVLFTRDPLTGAHDRFLVNVTLGLGEGLVSGSIGSDRFQIDNRTLVVEERAPSEKSSMIVPRPEGGVYQAEVPEPERRAPALSDDGGENPLFQLEANPVYGPNRLASRLKVLG